MKGVKQIWVDANFKKKLKSEASLKDMNLIDYTKELAEVSESLDDLFKKKKKDKEGFQFNF